MNTKADDAKKPAIFENPDGSHCVAIYSAKDQQYRLSTNPKVTKTETKLMVTGQVCQDQSWDTLDNLKKNNCPDAKRVSW